MCPFSQEPLGSRDSSVPACDELVGFFLRHLVPLLFTVQTQEGPTSLVYTAFALSVRERWFLITAGHCIHEIEALIAHYGYDNTRTRLIDCLGLGATHQEPIPWDYRGSQPIALTDDYGFDIGVMALSPYYRDLLQENDVQPLNEEVWKKQPAKVDFYALLGIAAELVEVNPESINVTPTLHLVEREDRRPIGFTEVDAPLFYGRIALGEGMRSIKGMSGGPVFGFHLNDKAIR